MLIKRLVVVGVGLIGGSFALALRRAGCVQRVVGIGRDERNLRKALELTHTGKIDLVVMTVHLLRGPDTGYQDLAEHRVFTEYEQLLFSRVVALAEKAGKHVELLVVPSSEQTMTNAPRTN